MKQLGKLTLALTFMSVAVSACKKEKVAEGETSEFPAPNPTSSLTVTASGTTYNLKVIGQAYKLADTAQVSIDATAPEFTVRLRAKSTQHDAGVGNYYLACCSNDVFDRSTPVQKHWEIDHVVGGLQNGSVTITRSDAKGYEGTFTVIANDYEISRTAKREFSGSFKIVY